MKKFLQLLFLTSLIVWLAMPTVHADASMSVQYQFGVDNKVAPNETVPVYVDITNNGADFSGDFVYDNIEIYNGGNGVVIPFEVKSGETVSLKFFIHGMSDNYIDNSVLRNRTFIYEGSVENGKEVNIDFPNLKAPHMLGHEAQRLLVISDNSKAVDTIKSYKNSVISNVEIAQTTTTDTSRLSTNTKDLEMYKVIYVDPTGAKLLNSDYVDTIIEWVRQGGKLFLAGDVGLETIPQVLAFENGKPTVLNSSSKPIKLQDGTIIAQMDYSSGEIIHSSAGFEQETFAGASQVENILENTFKQTYDNKYSVNPAYKAADWADKNGYFDTFYYNTNLIVLFIIIYIILVGPLLYLYLKRKDKREKMWLYIPILAVIASALLFVFGASDRIMKPKTQTMELVTLNGAGDAKVESSYAFVSNKRGEYTLTAPLNTNITAHFEGLNTSSEKIHQKAVLKASENEQKLKFRKVPFWSVQGAVAHEFQTGVGQLSNELQVQNGKLTGTITNDLQTDIENIMFISGKNIVELGSLDAAETLTVDEEIAFNTIANPVYQDIYGDEAAFSALSNKEKMHMEKIYRLINSAIDTKSHNGPILIAVTNKNFTNIKLTEEHTSKALTVLTQKPNVQLVFDGSFSLRSEEFNAEFKTLNPNQYADLYPEVDALYGSLHEGEHILQYSLPKGFVPESTTWSSLEVKHNPNELVVEIYNYDTKDYEEITASTWKNDESVTRFMNEQNVIQFKISTFTEYYGAMIKMPTFILKGEAHND